MHGESLKAHSTKRAAADVTSEREIRPLPSRNRNLMANHPVLTANPRPPKRRRDESWDNEYGNLGDVHNLGQRQLYTIPQDDSDDDEGVVHYVHDNDHFQVDNMGVMDPQPTSHFYAQRQTDSLIHPHRMCHREPPPFHEIIQSGLPPPSARSLDHHPLPPSRPTHLHSSRMVPAAAPAHSVAAASTSQAVAGPSRLGPTELRPHQGYYRKKPSKMINFDDWS